MWHLPVALEVITHVESSGRAFKVFVLEGNPQDWKERVAHLGSINSAQFEQRLMEDIFHFVPEVNDGKLSALSLNQ